MTQVEKSAVTKVTRAGEPLVGEPVRTGAKRKYTAGQERALRESATRAVKALHQPAPRPDSRKTLRGEVDRALMRAIAVEEGWTPAAIEDALGRSAIREGMSNPDAVAHHAFNHDYLREALTQRLLIDPGFRSRHAPDKEQGALRARQEQAREERDWEIRMMCLELNLKWEDNPLDYEADEEAVELCEAYEPWDGDLETLRERHRNFRRELDHARAAAADQFAILTAEQTDAIRERSRWQAPPRRPADPVDVAVCETDAFGHLRMAPTLPIPTATPPASEPVPETVTVPRRTWNVEGMLAGATVAPPASITRAMLAVAKRRGKAERARERGDSTHRKNNRGARERRRLKRAARRSENEPKAMMAPEHPPQVVSTEARMATGVVILGDDVSECSSREAIDLADLPPPPTARPALSRPVALPREVKHSDKLPLDGPAVRRALMGRRRVNGFEGEIDYSDPSPSVSGEASGLPFSLRFEPCEEDCETVEPLFVRSNWEPTSYEHPHELYVERAGLRRRCITRDLPPPPPNTPVTAVTVSAPLPPTAPEPAPAPCQGRLAGLWLAFCALVLWTASPARAFKRFLFPTLDDGGPEECTEAEAVGFRLASQVGDPDGDNVMERCATAVAGVGLRNKVKPVAAAKQLITALREVEAANAYVRREHYRRRFTSWIRRFVLVGFCVSVLLSMTSAIIFVAASNVTTVEETPFSNPAHVLQSALIAFVVSVVLTNPASLVRAAVIAAVVTLIIWACWLSVTWRRTLRATPLALPTTLDGEIDVDFFARPVWEGAYAVKPNRTNTTCLGPGDERKLGDQCEILTCVSGSCLAGDKGGATLIGWTTNIVYVLRKCLCNAHNALCNRHGTKQPPVTRDLDEVYPDFVKVLVGYDAHFWFQPMRTFATWLAKWPFGKRTAIEKSMASDDVLPGRVKTMVKREVNHKRPTKARLIQFYANLATQAIFGPIFYALQKTMCAAFRFASVSDDIDVTFASGMKAQEMAAWMDEVLRRGALQFYERDGKSWDATMQEMHSRFRRKIYRAFDSELADFVGTCDKVKALGVFPGGVLRYKMAFTVKSGHNDTTLGNSLINAAIAYAALKRLGLRASIIVAGDDLLVALYSLASEGSIEELEREYGIVPEARYFTSFAHVSFISGIWIRNGKSTAFIPQPGRLLHRLWWTVSPPSRRNASAYKRGVARGLLPVIGGLPILRVWLEKFDSVGVALSSDKNYIFRESAFDYGDDVWKTFADRYNLTVEQLVACEEWLLSLPAEPLLLVHPVLDRIVEVDTADISERSTDADDVFG